MRLKLARFIVFLLLFSSFMSLVYSVNTYWIENDNMLWMKANISNGINYFYVYYEPEGRDNTSVSSSGLVAYYKLDGDAIDSSGNGHDGTNNGATSSVDRFNRSNMGMNFDGSNDYIQVPDDMLGSTEPRTISIWFKWNGDTSRDHFLYAATRPSGEYTIIVKANGKVGFGLRDSSAWTYIYSHRKVDNNWHHVVGVWDGNTMYLYLDGFLETSTGFSAALGGNSYHTAIGRFGTLTDNGFFDGIIDEVRIYNRAFLYNEVKQIYFETGLRYKDPYQTFEFYDDFKNLSNWNNWGSPTPAVFSNTEFLDEVGYTSNGDNSYESGSYTKQLFNLTYGIRVGSRIKDHHGSSICNHINFAIGKDRTCTQTQCYQIGWVGAYGETYRFKYWGSGAGLYDDTNVDMNNFYYQLMDYDYDTDMLRFYKNGTFIYNTTTNKANYDTEYIVLTGRDCYDTNKVDYLYVAKGTDKNITIGEELSGNWLVNGVIYKKRKLIKIVSDKNIEDYNIRLSYNEFNTDMLLIKSKEEVFLKPDIVYYNGTVYEQGCSSNKYIWYVNDINVINTTKQELNNSYFNSNDIIMVKCNEKFSEGLRIYNYKPVLNKTERINGTFSHISSNENITLNCSYNDIEGDNVIKYKFRWYVNDILKRENVSYNNYDTLNNTNYNDYDNITFSCAFDDNKSTEGLMFSSEEISNVLPSSGYEGGIKDIVNWDNKILLLTLNGSEDLSYELVNNNWILNNSYLDGLLVNYTYLKITSYRGDKYLLGYYNYNENITNFDIYKYDNDWNRISNFSFIKKDSNGRYTIGEISGLLFDEKGNQHFLLQTSFKAQFSFGPFQKDLGFSFINNSWERDLKFDSPFSYSGELPTTGFNVEGLRFNNHQYVLIKYKTTGSLVFYLVNSSGLISYNLKKENVILGTNPLVFYKNNYYYIYKNGNYIKEYTYSDFYSTNFTIINNPPVITFINFTKNSYKSTEDIYIDSCNYTDLDGDSATCYCDWYVNNYLVVNKTQSLGESNYTKYDNVIAKCYVDDGYLNGRSSNSLEKSINITNAGPTINQVTIQKYVEVQNLTAYNYSFGQNKGLNYWVEEQNKIWINDSLNYNDEIYLYYNPVGNDNTSVDNTGLVAYYKLEGDVSDSSGNGNDGTVNGAVATSDRFGRSSKAMSFDGVDEYVDCGNSLRLVNDFTVSFWMKPEDNWKYPFGDSFDSNSGQYTGWFIDSYSGSSNRNGLRFGTAASSSSFEVVTIAQDLRNKWHHITFTKSSTTGIKMYIDGNLVKSDISLTSDVYYDSTNYFLIGVLDNDGTKTGWYKGLLDEIRIYNRVLTETEIKQLYQETSLKFQDGNKVFEFFDDFEGSNLDSVWTSTGTISLSNGQVKVENKGSEIKVQNQWGNNIKILAYVTEHNNAYGGIGLYPSSLDGHAHFYSSTDAGFCFRNSGGSSNNEEYDDARDSSGIRIGGNILSSNINGRTLISYDGNKAKFYGQDANSELNINSDLSNNYLKIAFGDGDNTGYIKVDYIAVTKYSPTESTINYGSEEIGEWLVNGKIYRKRLLVEIDSNKTINDYQIDLNYSKINDDRLFIVKKELYEGLYSNKNLKGYCEAEDIDLDQLSYEYDWYKNGQLILGVSENVLNTSYYTHFDNITLQCKAFDGEEYSDGLNSSNVTILNVKPEIDYVNIEPEEVYSNTTLYANCSASDYEGDALTYYYQWYKNGQELVGQNNNTLNISEFTHYDNITLECWVNDGYDNSTKVMSSGKIIQNIAPVMKNISFNTGYPLLPYWVEDNNYVWLKDNVWNKSEFYVYYNPIGNDEININNSGLVAYYKLEGDATDSSGNGNDGTVYGAVVTSDRFNRSSKAMYFDGNDDYVSGTIEPSLESTVSFWVYLNDNLLQFFMDLGAASAKIRNRVFTDSSGYLGCAYNDNNGNWYSMVSLFQLQTNQWYFITSEIGTNIQKLFVNGILIYENTNSGSPSLDEDSFVIGKDTGSSHFVNGKLDEFRVYNRILTETEIKQLYQETAMKFQDGDKVFEFFDDFENSNNWNVYGASVIEDSFAKVNDGGTGERIIRKESLNMPFTVIGRFKPLVSNEGTTSRVVNLGTWNQDVESQSSTGYIVNFYDSKFRLVADDNTWNGYVLNETSQTIYANTYYIIELTLSSYKKEAKLYDDSYSFLGKVESFDNTYGNQPHYIYITYKVWFDWIFIKKYKEVDINISYGSEETGNWNIEGYNYTKRRKVIIDMPEYIKGYQYNLDYNQFNDSRLMIIGLNKTNVFSEQNDIIANCTGEDYEGDNLIYYYKWYKNGQLIQEGLNKNRLTRYDFVHFDNIIVQCIAYDGEKYSGLLESNNLTIQNLKPEVDYVNIEPQEAYSNDTLIANCSFDDYEEDNLTYYYQWYKNGQILMGQNNDSLNVSEFTHFDNITLECWTFDGYNYSDKVNSSVKEIKNVIPYITNVTFNASYSEINMVVDRCDYYDYENDNISYNYRWYVNDIIIDTDNVLEHNKTLVGDRVILSCMVNDTNQSAWVNSSLYIIPNHLITDYSDIENTATNATEIDDYVNFTGDVTGYGEISKCVLILKPVNSTFPFNQVNVNLNKTGNYSDLFTIFQITPYYTTEYSNVSYWVWCNDSEGNYGNSSMFYFQVGDYTKPNITFDASKSDILVDGIVVDNINHENISVYMVIQDYNLFYVGVNISCENKGVIYTFEDIGIDNQTYIFNKSISIKGYEPQRCVLQVVSTDDHTEEHIDNYDYIIENDEIKYYTNNKLYIGFKAYGDLDKLDTRKLDDRYIFKVNYNDNALIRKYEITSDYKLYVRKRSHYPVHFVVWNEEVQNGNWIDLNVVNPNDYIYVINKISDYDYEVILVHKLLKYPYNEEQYMETKKSWLDYIIDLFRSDIPYNYTTQPLERYYDLGSIDSLISDNITEEQMNHYIEYYGIHDIQFNSVGGANKRERNSTFYIGGVFNITSLNAYNNSYINGYNVTLYNIDYEETRSQVLNETSHEIPNVKQGRYKITITHPDYLTKTYYKIMEAQYDICTQYQANESVVCNNQTGNYSFSDINDILNEENMFDNDTNTYAEIVSLNYTYIYINYSVMENSSFANWEIYAFGGDKVSINLDTTNKTVLQLRIKAKQGEGNDNIKFEEYNGTGWQELSYVTSLVYESKIYEEQMKFYTQLPNRISFVYNTSQALITFVYHNVKTEQTVNNYTIKLYDLDNGINKTFNVSDGSNGITLPLNSNVTYRIVAQKDGFFTIDKNYSFNTGDIKTIHEYFNYNATFIFYDEYDKEPYDFAATYESHMDIKCKNYTRTYQLDNTTLGSYHDNATNSTKFGYKIVVPIDCNYENVKFHVTYPGAENYYRTLMPTYEESLNLTVFLLDMTQAPYVYNSFILDDLMGRYINPSVWIKKNINGKTYTIYADTTDMEDKVGLYLIENNEYEVEIHSDNMPIYVLGKYSADVGGEKVISLNDINLANEPVGMFDNVRYTIIKTTQNNQTGVLFGYEDAENNTESVQFKLYKKNMNGTLLYSSDVLTDINSIGSVFVPLDSSVANYTIVGVIDIKHKVEGEKLITKILNKGWLLGLPLMEYVDPQFMSWVLLILLSVVAIFASVQTSMVSVFVTGLGILFLSFGWMQVSKSVLALAILIAIVQFLSGKKNK